MKTIEVKGTASFSKILLMVFLFKIYILLAMFVTLYLYDSDRLEWVPPVLFDLGAGTWLTTVVLIAWTLELVFPPIWNGIAKKINKKREV